MSSLAGRNFLFLGGRHFSCVKSSIAVLPVAENLPPAVPPRAPRQAPLGRGGGTDAGRFAASRPDGWRQLANPVDLATKVTLRVRSTEKFHNERNILILSLAVFGILIRVQKKSLLIPSHTGIIRVVRLRFHHLKLRNMILVPPHRSMEKLLELNLKLESKSTGNR